MILLIIIVIMRLIVQWLNFSNWPAGVKNKEIMASAIIKQ